MSPWCDELRIALCADRVVWARIARGWPRRIAEKRVIDVEAGAALPIWRSPVGALSRALKASGFNGEAVVILSNRFVRYAVVPWHDQLMKREERGVQARQCFRELYGDTVGKWAVGISESRYGKSVLASAVDAELVEGIRAAFRQNGARLRSIGPSLTSAYGYFRQSLKAAGPQYFAVSEPDSLAALFFDGGELKLVSNQRSRESWQRELELLHLQRAGEYGSLPPTFLWAPAEPPAAGGPIGVKRLAIREMKGYSPANDGQLAMALAGS